jgi:TIR domain
VRKGVFVCHASHDAGAAQRAVVALEAAGVGCWIAPRDIDAGENYTQAILDALDAAPAVVLMFSSATNESPHVSRELEIAVGAGRRIVPVRLEAVEPSGALRYFIGTSQWLDATGVAGDWSDALVRAVRRAVGQEAGPTTVIRSGPIPAGLASTPTPDPTPAAVPTPDRPRPTWWRGALVGGGLVAAVILAVVVTMSLTGGDDGKDDSESVSPASPSSEAAVNSNGTAADTSGPVTCWDNSSAPDAAHCSTPTGLAGLATVFPGLTPACTPVDSPIEGKAEVYECQHDGFIVRFTRWDPGFDKETYYEVENPVASQQWEVGGEPAGLQWFSIENDPEETEPYQWSAAYDGLPFSLSVEGETSADRSSGVSELKLVPPSRIGLK